MNPAIDGIWETLAKVRGGASYAAEGRVEAAAPAVHVTGFGRLDVPFDADALTAVRPAARPAPFGRGEQTLYDDTVRRCLQVDSDVLALKGRGWKAALARIVAEASAALGVTGPVEANLYKLLLYAEGDFFVPHRDTEKEPGMFATLLITLPSRFTGGEVWVEHGGATQHLSVRPQADSELAWAAFYADCRHEVRPIESGARATLVYNLVRRGAQPLAAAPAETHGLQEELEERVLSWLDDAPPAKLCVVLGHHYTQAELSWAALKGADAARAELLRDVAEALDLRVFLALLEVEEAWSAEELYYRRPRRGWRRYDRWDEPEVGPGDVEVYDLIERNRLLTHWRDADDERIAGRTLALDDDELCPSEALDADNPDDFSYHEATGNEGATVMRSYRRAAVVIWPAENDIAVLAQGGFDEVMLALAECERADERAEALAYHAARLVPPPYVSYGRSSAEGLRRLVAALCRLRLPGPVPVLFERFRRARGLDDAGLEALTPLLDLMAPDAAAKALEPLVAEWGLAQIKASAALVALATRRSGHPASTWAPLVDAATLSLRAPSGREVGWYQGAVAPKALSDLLWAAAETGASAAAERLLGAVQAGSDRFPFDATVRPALVELARAYTTTKPAGGAAPALLEPLWKWAIAELRRRVATAPVPFADARRAPVRSCKCADCAALSLFLEDPGQVVAQFPLNEHRRNHVASVVGRDHLDVKTSLVREGSPYRLRCMKTTASYDRLAATYAENTAAIEVLAALASPS